NRIITYKEMGLSLEAVALLLDENLPIDDFRATLTSRREELIGQIAESQAQVARIEAELLRLDDKDTIYRVPTGATGLPIWNSSLERTSVMGKVQGRITQIL